MSTKPIAVLGNYKDPDLLIAAANRIRESGYKDFDIFTPYPVHGLDKAMGVKRTILPYISFGGGIFGLANAIFLIMWTSSVHYKLNIGGKPLFAFQFSIPVMFELTILCTAIFTFLGLWFLCGLPKWYSPLQNDKGFMSAVDNTFVVGIMATDQRFSIETTKKLMTELGADDVRLVQE